MTNETIDTAMGSISAIIAVVVIFGTVWKYLKIKYAFRVKLEEFNRCKGELQRLRETTETTMRNQLQGPGNVVREDVQNWLDAAGVEISEEQSVEYLVKQKGILSLFYRTGIVKTRTAALNRKFETGEILIREGNQLVDDDASLERFTKQKEKLEVKLREVEVRLKSQLLVPGNIETGTVELWRGEVETITGQTATDIETKFNGRVPQGVEFPDLVRQKIREMELLCEGAPLPESLVISDPSASEPPMLTPELQGNHDVKEEILGHLMGDETAKIGVWGMGGVGKTTIMMHVYNQLLKEPKFKKVVWVTVSETSDIHQIQHDIASSLQKDEILPNQPGGDLRAAAALPGGDLRAAAALSKILEMHKPYVLILDDVWKSFGLREVGVREIPGCKLVLTTRSEEVVRTMECKLVQVNTLSTEDSLKLFKDTARVEALPDDEGTLEGMVGECGGLPLAIKAVAASMKGETDPRLWRAALEQLKEGSINVAGAEYDPFRALKFSYDRVENPNIQQCFLQCVLYPEDAMIITEDLIDCWIDGELIDVDGTLREMKDEGHSILKKLVGNCLLESFRFRSGMDGVRMHDLMRIMALRITRTSDPRFLVRAGKGLRKLPGWNEWKGDLSKVSLMSNYITIVDIPPSLPLPRCQILTTLLLSNNWISTIPEHFFEHMPELRVLDLSRNIHLSSLPSSVSSLVKLTTLLLRDCSSLEKLPSLSSLTALKKLDLHEAGVEEVPQGVEMLLNLKYLDIRNRSRKNTAEWIRLVSKILLNLSELQHLVLDPRVPVEGGQLGRIWPNLESFYGSFRTWSDMSIFLNNRQKRLYDYNIYAGDPNNAPLYLGELKCISCYDRGKPGLIPSDVERLSIRGCNDVISLNAISRFQLLKLKKLELWHLENLKGLFDSEAAATATAPLAVFPPLEEVSIGNCPRIKRLFPTTLQHLPNLKDISVRNCSQLEEIMVASEEEEGRVIHAKLEKLTLVNLPVLKSISSLTVASVFGCLKELEISRCPNLNGYIFGGQFKFSSLHSLEILRLDGLRSLKSIFHEEADESHAPSGTETISYPLKELQVENCPQLKKIFPQAVQSDSFQNLERIEVKCCDELVEIMAVSSEREEDQSKLILPELMSLELTRLLPKLQILSLIELPALRRIYPALLVAKEIQVEKCPQLKTIFPHGGSLDYLRHIKQIKVKGCDGLEEIMTTSLESEENQSELILPELMSLELTRLLPELQILSLIELPVLRRICPALLVAKEIQVENCPQLKTIFTHGGSLDYLRYIKQIKVKGCNGLEEIMTTSLESEENQSKLFLPELVSLKLTRLPALKRFCSPTAFLVVLGSLRDLTIEDCPGLSRVGLPQNLDSLTLKGVRNLESVDDGEASDSLAFWRILPPAATSTFALERIHVVNCPQLKRIFSPTGRLDYFQSICSIEVEGCDGLEEIMATSLELEENQSKPVLPELVVLRLTRLPALRRLCSPTALLVPDSVLRLTIEDCPGLSWELPKTLQSLSLRGVQNVESVFAEEASDSLAFWRLPPAATSTFALQEIRVANCPQLKRIFSHAGLLDYFQNIREFIVTRCDELEEIISSKSEEESIKVTHLPKLEKLHLRYLPKLKRVCTGTSASICDSLKYPSTSGCPELVLFPMPLPESSPPRYAAKSSTRH